MEGQLGSHSLRKYAAQCARENGCTMDDIEIRGRWKGGRGKRMVGRYIDPNQAFIDTKTAAALCVGGAVKYKLKAEAGLTKEWIRANVVKGISDSYSDENKIAGVLGPVLLWACFEPTVRNRVPENVRNRIEEAYASIRTLEEDVNPVQKLSLNVYRTIADQVCFVAEDELGVGEVDPYNNPFIEYHCAELV